MPVLVTGHAPDGPCAGHQVDLPVTGPHPDDRDVRRDRGGAHGRQHDRTLPRRDVEVEGEARPDSACRRQGVQVSDVQPQRHGKVGIVTQPTQGVRGPDADLRLGQDVLGDAGTSTMRLDQQLPGVGDGRERAGGVGPAGAAVQEGPQHDQPPTALGPPERRDGPFISGTGRQGVEVHGFEVRRT